MATRIVVLGGGVAGAEAIRRVHEFTHHKPNLSITIVDKNNHTTFIPMLHEVATGAVNPMDITFPLRQIVNCCLERFHQASVESVDLEQKLVRTDKGVVPYDYLVVALGSTTNFFHVPGAEEHSLVLKTLEDAILLRRQLIDSFEAVSQLSPDDPHRSDRLHFVIVGAGYTGVETAGQMADLFSDEFRLLYPEIRGDEPKITIVQGADRVLPVLSEKSSASALHRLSGLGVNVITGTMVTSITPEGVALSTGEVLPTHNVIWTSGIVGLADKFFDAKLVEKGRLKARSTLQILNHPEAFVIGDIAGVVEGSGPHPQTAQAAVQQARAAAENIHHLIEGEPVRAFRYNHKGDLVPVGNRWAIAEIKGLRFTGFIAWWLRRTVYLEGLFSWADRIRVVFTWTINLFTKRDTTRL